MEPLQIAINMEAEGKEFYQKASDNTSDKLGKALFDRLAKEEDFHAAKAREISDFLKLGEQPLAIEESLDHGIKLRSIFAQLKTEIEQRAAASKDEMDIIGLALDIEDRSIKFYREQAAKVENEFIKRFFTALAEEEHGHYLSLVDYRQYLTSPADWFAEKEHHSLDGG